MNEHALATTNVSVPLKPEEIESVINATDILNAILNKQISKYERARRFTFPFEADESFIRKIQQEIVEHIDSDKIVFEAKVAFDDLSSVVYDSFDDFLRKAANQRDPERAILSWSTFSINGQCASAKSVEIKFITEKKLVNEDSSPGDIHHSVICLTVMGSNASWVDSTFNNVEPFVKETKIAGMYRPLWIFRSKFYVQITSWIIAMSSWAISFNLIGRILFSKEDSNKNQLDIILESVDLNNKIDTLSTAILKIENSPWWDSIVYLLGSFFVMAVMYIIGLCLLPKLSPRSCIVIGLNTVRFKRYINTFKFVIFNLMVLGLISPLIIALISRLF